MRYACGFPGSFDEDAGEVILESCGVEGSQCLKTLEGRSLIDHYVLGNEVRYRLHRLIREYFRVHISKPSDIELFNTSFRRYYPAIILELCCKGQINDVLIHKLEVENQNLEYLFSLLCNRSDSVLQDEDVAVLGFYAYREDNLTLCVPAWTILNHLILNRHNYSDLLDTTLYDSFTSKLLFISYQEGCNHLYNYEHCRCTDLCTTAIVSHHSYSTRLPYMTFLYSCVTCIASKLGNFCIILIIFGFLTAFSIGVQFILCTHFLKYYSHNIIMIYFYCFYIVSFAAILTTSSLTVEHLYYHLYGLFVPVSFTLCFALPLISQFSLLIIISACLLPKVCLRHVPYVLRLAFVNFLSLLTFLPFLTMPWYLITAYVVGLFLLHWGALFLFVFHILYLLSFYEPHSLGDKL